MTTTAGGILSVTNSGLLTTQGLPCLDGAFDQDGTGAVNLGGDISTTGDNIGFDRSVSLTSDVQLNSAAGNIDFAAGATIDGHSLTLTAATGNIALGDVGATTALTGLDVNSATQLNVNGSANVSGNIDVDGGTVNLNNLVTTASGGTLTVSNTGVLTTLNNLNLDGAFSQDGTGAVSLGGNITTTSDLISFNSGVT